jgi:hypothetical protein
MADDNFLAAMTAAPRFCTSGMNSFSHLRDSTVSQEDSGHQSLSFTVTVF